MTVLRIPRSAEACARLRPSASASAKLANNTVNNSQMQIARIAPGRASPWPASACTYSSAVTMVPMYTTNMTGLRHCTRGSSLVEGLEQRGPEEITIEQRELTTRHVYLNGRTRA